MEREEKIQYLKKLKQEERELTRRIDQLEKISANKTKIMNTLHEYNDIKDATQVVFGHLASLHGVTVNKVHEKFDLITK